MSKGIMGNGGLLLRNWSSRGFSLIEGNNTHSCINASSFLLTEVNWTSSLSSLPIIPIGIVVTLFLSGTVETGCILNMSRGFACEQAHLWVTTRAAKSKTIRREGVSITFLSRGFAARFRARGYACRLDFRRSRLVIEPTTLVLQQEPARRLSEALRYAYIC